MHFRTCVPLQMCALHVNLCTSVPVYLSTCIPLQMSVSAHLSDPVNFRTCVPDHMWTYAPLYMHLCTSAPLHMHLCTCRCPPPPASSSPSAWPGALTGSPKKFMAQVARENLVVLFFFFSSSSSSNWSTNILS